ncbi:MAG: prolipoprotein diacylglyceryl transferase [Candidatus Poseidoniaceae archaeon]|jgi:prolipoprotein diacylglyceryltransferase|nr:prolipoprotein diacylglyceryl transferase [Candidatus Poseidoniaceae archaeon]
MEFPMFIMGIHPHMFFEFLGWVAAVLTMVAVRRRIGDPLSDEQRVQVALAGLFGALLGAKILAWLEHPQTTFEGLSGSPALLIGGKTVVGGLLGGMIGVETAKKFLGINTRTGDQWVLPLAVGMSIGRLGCFFSGLDDATFGYSTSMPWGVDFGDGVTRHPTQLYEILFIWILIAWINTRQQLPKGGAFRAYMVGYLWWRLLIDWMKPADAPLLTLSAIQFACIGGLFWYHRCGVIRVKVEGIDASSEE